MAGSGGRVVIGKVLRLRGLFRGRKGSSAGESGGDPERTGPAVVSAPTGGSASGSGGDPERTGTPAVAPVPAGGSAGASDGDWKRQVMEDFRQWLDAAGGEPPAPDEPGAADCDLRDLFAEFAALRQEVRLQNREQAKAGRELSGAAARFDTASRALGDFAELKRELSGAAARFDTAVGQAERRDEDLAAFEARVSRTAEDRCIVETLEVRDALERGRDAAVRLRDGRRLFGRPPRGAAGVVEGYELAIGRFDRMLSRFGVRRVETAGRPFDGRVMHAMEARRVDHAGDGVVVEELRSGFVRQDDVLRFADVAVNRRGGQE